MPSKSWVELNKEENFENIVNKILSNGKLNNTNIAGKTINNKLLTKLMKRENINNLIEKAKRESGFNSKLTKEEIKQILSNYLNKKTTPSAKKKDNEEVETKKKESKKKIVTFRNRKIGPNGEYKKLSNVKTFNLEAEIKNLENKASKTITKAVRKTAEKSKENKAKAEKLKKTEKKNTTKALKKINEVKIYLKNLKSQINNSYKKKSLSQFVFLNFDKIKNNSLTRQKLTNLLKSGIIIKHLIENYNGKTFFNVSYDEWYLCMTGYIEKESNEISHQLGLIAYKKDNVKNFSEFKNKANKFKFKTKIFLDLGKNNKLINISLLTAKIKKYLNSKVKNKNNYEKGFQFGNVLVENNNMN